ncbi:WYL domain-containing protein [Actinomyces lilanjuaniae]|uniref:WYL domain-containing protein n=1 Tax=Actinomyces lilanjuaniae TaxID=2321394 RepID=A0ABM6Z3R1_9ACTO|nr:WYL domain-containing protein [Actinomyces lilanjuaniae]AYD89788.1 WYL domain-containing protein [Actinomyces lilanjuaniae]
MSQDITPPHSPDERLVSLVVTLRSTATGMTTSEILRKVPGYDATGPDSARRKLERDKETLRDLGITLSTTGSLEETRYRIEDLDYVLPPLRLEPGQVAALELAASAWQDGWLPATARRALTKLRAVSRSAQGAEDPLLPALSADLVGKELPEMLVTAVDERRRVTFDYLSAHSGTTRSRTVEPHRLRLSNGAWYLDGLETDTGEYRTFRLARLRGEVTVVSDRHAFTPAAPQQEPTPHEAVLALLPGRGLSLRSQAVDYLPVRQAHQPDPSGSLCEPPVPGPSQQREHSGAGDGTSDGTGASAGSLADLCPCARLAGYDLLRVRYEDSYAFAGSLAGLGEAVLVLDPPLLRDMVLSHLHGTAALAAGGLPRAQALHRDGQAGHLAAHAGEC